MTNLILLIMPLVAGYWFLSVWNFTKYKARRNTGYRLFLESAFAGIAFLFIAKLAMSALSVLLLINSISIDFISVWFIPTGFSLESTLAMIIGIVSPLILNCFSDKQKSARRTAVDHGDLLYLTISKAIDERQLIELAMNNGKVYIGFVTITGDLDVKYVNLIPYASGYRDEKTKNLIIINHYEEAVLEVTNKGIKPSDLSVTLKMDDVAMARIFHPEIYADGLFL